MIHFKNSEDLKSFSEKMTKECSSEGTYSIYDAAERIDASEQQIHEWALYDQETMSYCRHLCFNNTKDGLLRANIFDKEAVEHMKENNADFKKCYKILVQNDEEKEAAFQKLIFHMVLP